MSKFQEEFTKVTNMMLIQVFQFSDIVIMISKVTEMEEYPAKFIEAIEKVEMGIPSEMNKFAIDKLFAFLDIVKLQRAFLNDLLNLPEITEIPGGMDTVVDAHDTLDNIQSKVTQLAFLEGGE